MLEIKENIERWKESFEAKCLQIFYKKKLHLGFFILLVLIMFVLVLVLNQATPWISDDFFVRNTALTFSAFSDFFAFAYNNYFAWCGRFWAYACWAFLLSLSKSLVNILNTLAYMALVFLMYFNILGRRKVSISLFIGINFLLWSFLPTFGQDIFWVSGSCQYLWSILIPLLFLMLWRLYYDRPYQVFSNLAMVATITILGFFAGWMHELVSAALLFILICFSAFYKIRDKKIPLFAIAGLASTFIGTVLLVVAPGNFARHSQQLRTLGSFIEDLIRNPAALIENAPLLVILLAVLLMRGKSKNKILSVFYAVSAFVMCIVCIPMTHIRQRIMFAPIVFLIIAVGILFEEEFTDFKDKKLRVIIATILIIGMGALFSEAREGIDYYNEAWQENVQIIEASKAKGKLDVVVNPVVPTSKFCGAYDLWKFVPSDEFEYFDNRQIAIYYKLHSLRSVRIKQSN
ncbi:MAG: DUF6056 family protein [Synergistaceae bacterium]|nr:DUF6056 family protein [Synergistaceae bacterium]